MSTFRDTFGVEDWFDFVQDRAEGMQRDRSNQSLITIFEVYCFVAEFRDGGLLQYLQSYSADGYGALKNAFERLGFRAGNELFSKLEAELDCTTIENFKARQEAIVRKFGDPLTTDPLASLSKAFEANMSELDAIVESFVVAHAPVFSRVASRHEQIVDRPALKNLMKKTGLVSFKKQ